MRDIDPGLAAHLASRTTTLCHCWKLTTRDGEAMGFTDHDRDLTFDGVTFEAQAGFTASEIESNLGFSVDNLDASGALSSARLNEGRIEAGDFDHAAVEVWLVNWTDPGQRLLLRKGNAGEITRGSLGFTAEVRGLTHLMDQPQGRLFQYGCDAVLGDARCTINLDNVLYQGAGSVHAAEEDRRLTVDGLDQFDDTWFSRGTLHWTSGANAGRRGEIKIHHKASGKVHLELWQTAPGPVALGDAFTIRAGCDKQFATCRSKFANGLNFRGFPQMPGDDFVLTYPTRDDPANTGDSRN